MTTTKKTTTAISPTDTAGKPSALAGLTTDQIELLKRTIARGTTNDELALFVEVANATGLNPFKKQIHAVKRGDTMTIQTGIDGYRLLAERSGKYRPGAIEWTGSDEKWTDVWVRDTPPVAARATVYRTDFTAPADGALVPITAVARFKSYAQRSPIWDKMPELMLGKCAEALAIRRAFPDLVGGIYTDEEMTQTDAPARAAAPLPSPLPANVFMEPDPAPTGTFKPVDGPLRAAADYDAAPPAEPEKKPAKKSGYIDTAAKLVPDAEPETNGSRIDRTKLDVLRSLAKDTPETAREFFYTEWLTQRGYARESREEQYALFVATGSGDIDAAIAYFRQNARTAQPA